LEFIGINGGTFDPIHFGHLRPALEVSCVLDLKHVEFIPCYQPVHRAAPVVTADHRCRLIELAIQSQPKFRLNQIEIEKGGPSYMVETLEALHSEYEEKGLVLMMGTDAFSKFDKWYRYQDILKVANIAIMHRPGEPVPQAGDLGRFFKHHWVPSLTEAQGQIVDVPVTQLDLSATALRSFLKNNQMVDFLVPDDVRDYILKHHLYQ